jgi:hypothetical protein
MNLYKLMKMAVGHGLPRPVKLAGLAAMFRLRRRTAGVFLDPVMACNLRCRMCYFSDPVKRAQMKGIMSDPQLNACAKSIFPYALKLQIGCGAEPTLYPNLEQIIATGRQYGVPYISLTTNGQLIGSGKCPLEPLVRAGLNELTLSLHGTTQEVYENLMPGANFGTFGRMTAEIARVKRLCPDFKLRVNYTVNSLNVHDLKGDRFWNLWHEGGLPDIVQLRPVQKIGDSDWKDFDPQPLIDNYDTSIGAVAAECRKRGIMCIAPTCGQIEAVAGNQDETAALIEELTYVYVSPQSCYKDDFNPEQETYAAYHKRRHTVRRLLEAALRPASSGHGKNVSKKLNYTIK